MIGTAAVAVGVGAVLSAGIAWIHLHRPARDTVSKALAAVPLPGASARITEWEHGLKTDRVVATRYKTTSMGYTIGFAFPRDMRSGDRTELFWFMETQNGWVYQGGGFPGAPLMTRFKDVTDRDTANEKMREVLPALHTLISDLSAGKPVNVVPPKPRYEWPDTEPPTPGSFGASLSTGRTIYKKAEVSPGRWQWVKDREAMRWFEERDTKKRALYWSLRSRVLTDEEMAEVGRHGKDLNIESGVSYRAEEKARELNDALLQQFRLRTAAQRAAPTAPL